MIDLHEPLNIEELSEQFDLEVKKAQGRHGQGEFPADFLPSYSAMANTNGGIIILGIEEYKTGKFKVLGIQDTAKVLKALWDGLNNRQRVSANLLSEADVQIREVQEKSIIVVNIPRASRTQRPIFIGSNPLIGTYRRNYEGDYRCDEDMVRRMIAEQIEDSRDAKLLEGFTMNDLEPGSLKAYRSNFKALRPDHPWNDLDDTEFIRSLGGWTRDRSTGKQGLTLAGLLMFGKLRSILDAVPTYMVDYQERPEPKAELRWSDRLTLDGTWSGNLFDFYKLVINRLTRDLKVPFKLAGTVRVDETPVHEALREALVNTLIHADYSGRVPILVVKRPDMFGFRNPGTLRIPIKDALQGGISDCRNRNLQKMFQMIGSGEQAGSGIPKIFRDWKSQSWRPPELIERLDTVEHTLLTLRMVSILPEEVLKEMDERFGKRFCEFTELQRSALVTAAIEGEVTNDRLSQLSTEHSHDITKSLSYLVVNGFLQSNGNGRGTYYFLSGPDPRTGQEFTMSGALINQVEPVSSRLHHKDNSLHHKGENLHHKEKEPGIQPFPEPQENTDIEKYFDVIPPDAEMMKTFKIEIEGMDLGKRSTPDALKKAITYLCKQYPLTAAELAELLQRSVSTVRNHYIAPMVKNKQLQIAYPNKPNHPQQRYRTPKGK
jgi:ATP-dependent DNA helicase RecG